MGIPVQCRLFHDSKRHRDSENLYKDAETNPIIRDTNLTPDSHVLFMPGKYGPEVDIAVKEKGLPRDHVWTIEYRPDVHRFQKAAGWHITPIPMGFCAAVPFIDRFMDHPGFDLVYLDFQTLLTPRYVETIGELLDRRMIRRGGKLVVSAGMSSYRIHDALELSRRYRKRHPDWPPHLPITHKIVEDILWTKRVFWREADYRKYTDRRGFWHVVSYVKF